MPYEMAHVDMPYEMAHVNMYIYFERSRVLPTTMIYIYSYHIKYGRGGEEGETRHIFQSLYSEL